MRRYIYIAISIATLLMAASCTKDVSTEFTGKGGISLAATIDNAATRATDSETLLNEASVKIYKPNFDGLVRSYTYADMPQVIYLPEGNGYRVDVVAGELVKATPAMASFESKSYKGSAEFDVTAGVTNTTPITVKANICNAISNITFGNSIAENFEAGYKVTIGMDGNNLEYNADNSGTDGYFIISPDAEEPKLEWSFSGVLLKNGETFTKTGSFAVEAGNKYVMNLKYTEKDGRLTIDIWVDKETIDFNDQIIFEPTTVGLTLSRSYEIWANHAIVHAEVSPQMYDATKVYFEYKKSSDSEWTRHATAATPDSEKSDEKGFSATLKGLDASTEYEYRLVVTNLNTLEEETIAATRTFTTDVEKDVENGSFEDTCMENKMPAFFPEGGTKWWCCGNQAVKKYVDVPTVAASSIITSSSTDVPGESKLPGSKQSVKMESKQLNIMGINKFAAGNIFYGQYYETIGTVGGSVYFGRPFTARPVGLRCWIKYVGGQVTHTGDGSPISKGAYDIAQLKVVLGIWDAATYGGNNESPVNVNTTLPETFIDYAADAYNPKDPDNSGRTLAYGDLQITSAAAGADYVENINGTTQKRNYTEWQEVVIPLEYYDQTTMPTHLIISAAASKYGDYLSGCNGGTMWLDGVELIYDLNEL